MPTRTYGWVQNPSNFSSLKRTTQIFDPESEHYHNLRKHLVPELIPFEETKRELLGLLEKRAKQFSYSALVGSKRDKNGNRNISRKSAVADALIQVSIQSQSAKTTGKTWTDNWTAAGYLSWALSLDFLRHDRDTDTCTITDRGLRFSRVEEGGLEEKQILQEAFLRYPPAVQVLRILSESRTPATKFKIGSKLGFKGEKGFTSYPEDLMMEWIESCSDKAEIKKIRQDVEGTSDKYARMIAGWLKKVGFVKTSRSYFLNNLGEKCTGFPRYSITGAGEHALRKAQGSSSNSVVEKYLTWEFLAVGSAESDYTRSRRAEILTSLSKSSSKRSLFQYLESKGYTDDTAVIKNDIKGLNTFGLKIVETPSHFELKDNFAPFSIPTVVHTPVQREAEFLRLKEKIMAQTDLEPKYYELIDMAYDGNRNRDFEMMTVDLFTKVYGFQGKFLGGSRKPDGIIYTNDFGITIDTKAYSGGYGKSISQEDEMVRYIEDNQLRDDERNPTKWWENYAAGIPSDAHHFLWVSSNFKDSFSPQLLSTSHRTKCTGGALDVEQLLIGADLVQKHKLELSDVEAALQNQIIFWNQK